MKAEPSAPQILYVVYGVIQIALVALWATPVAIRTRASVANAVMSLIGSLALGVLSLVEHQKTIRPSLIIEFYLAFTLLFDAARVRTLWMQGYNGTIAAVITVSLALKIILLCVEALGKRRMLCVDGRVSHQRQQADFLRSSRFGGSILCS